jgi:hypothetical protein
MSRQPTHRRTTRSLALVVAVAALVGTVGAGQALATQASVPDEPAAVPDERVLERQGRIDQQTTLGQLDEQGRITLPPRLSGEDRAAVGPAGAQRRFSRPEPPVGSAPQPGDQQVATGPARTEPAGGRGGLAVVVVVVAALLAAVGAATTWRVRQRRPQPDSTA